MPKSFIVLSRSRHPGVQGSAMLQGFGDAWFGDAWRETMVAPPPFAWAKPAPSAQTRQRPQRPNCPHCGSRLFVAEQSRFNLAGRIDHVWACDDCGTEFETSIALARQAVA